MRSFSITILFEIVVVIIVLFFILTSNIYPNMYFKGYEKEDLYASLISINYLNLSDVNQLNRSIYMVVTNILPYYYVLINGELYFNNTDFNDVKQGIRTFYIVNGSIYYVDIYWK
ncbi:MAG: hypothetical protein ACP5G1_00575 [Nanopusillaceae archaeon]